MTSIRTTLLAATAMLLSAASVPASAQQADTPDSKGTTSGPAAGSNVEPGTVTQKKKHHHKGHKAAATNDAAGAAGVAGDKGSENGAAPDKTPPQ